LRGSFDYGVACGFAFGYAGTSRSTSARDDRLQWAPEKWPAGMLPISLIAFVAAVFPLLIKRKTVAENEQKKKGREENAEKSG
jgi:hypothetical protein